MNERKNPHLLQFPSVGESSIGYISISEFGKSIPFDVVRIFWTYYTPESVIRGRHAHHQTEQVLIAAAGRIIVLTELADGTKERFVLENPGEGLYIPPWCWHSMQYSHSSVQLVLASTPFNESDYIRDHEQFLTVYAK